MNLVCLDLEGVLIPEIWVNVALKTGIEELKLTTREVPDYDVLMKRRLQILEQNKLTLKEIQEVIGTMDPMAGAPEFLETLRSQFQVVILSDTFYEFAHPFMKKLGWPTLFAHSLVVDAQKKVTNYSLRIRDQKREAVVRFKELNFRVLAAGDSYNDLSMILNAHKGAFFCPPEKITLENPTVPVAKTYQELLDIFLSS